MKNKADLVATLAALASAAITLIAAGLTTFAILGIGKEVVLIMIASMITAFVAVLVKFMASRTKREAWEKSIASYSMKSTEGIEPKKMVFLSYAKEDRDRVSELRKAPPFA